MMVDIGLVNIYIYIYIYACGVTIIVIENGHSDTSQKLDEAVCISQSDDTLENDMKPIILHPTMDKK